MSIRFRILVVILALFILVDGLAWVYTNKIATGPSPEQLRKQAAITPQPATSPVIKQKDDLRQSVSLDSEWLYRQPMSVSP